MPKLAKASVDLVLCDLPYGVTDCAWDKTIDAKALWAEYRRVLRLHGAIVLFAQGAFCAKLLSSAPTGWFRYEWIWDKRAASGFLNARRMPMRAHENILVFGRQIRYFPQGLRRIPGGRLKVRKSTDVYRPSGAISKQEFTGYPTTILRVERETGAKPCQKPIALLEYLIRTYTLRGATVLDNAMGLGSTGVAARRTGRNFIGIEIDADRFGVARKRIRSELGQPTKLQTKEIAQ